MGYQEEQYPQFSKDFHGGTTYTRDKSPIAASSVQMTVLSADVSSPAQTTVWRVPDFTRQVNDYTVEAKVLCGPGTSFVLVPGRYRCWYRITDNPEDSSIPDPSTFRIV